MNLEHYNFFASYHAALKKLVVNDDFQSYGRLMFRINEYALYATEPEESDFTTLEAVVWDLIRPILERTRAKAMAGKTGGAKSKAFGNTNAAKTKQKPSRNEAETKQNQAETKQKQTEEEEEEEEEKEKGNINVPKGTSVSLSEEASDYLKLQNWINKELKHVAKIENQLTEKELDKLLSNYDKNSIFETLKDLDNYHKDGKPAEKCYTSVYRTVGNWLRRNNKDIHHGE